MFFRLSGFQVFTCGFQAPVAPKETKEEARQAAAGGESSLSLDQDPSADAASAAEIKQETTAATSAPQQTASVAIFGSEVAGEEKLLSSPAAGAEPARPSHMGPEPNSPAVQVPQIANVTEDTEMEGSNQRQLTVHQDDTPAASHGARSASPAADRRGKRRDFIVLCRENGWLQLYALPEMDLIFAYQHATDGPAVMGEGGCSPNPAGLEGGSALQTVEVCMQSFGPSSTSGR